MLLDVSFLWDCLTERKENVLVLGQLWLQWLFIVISSAVLCMLPSAGILQWDFLPSSLQGWSLGSSPGQAALASQLLKKNTGYLWGSSVSPSVLLLALAVKVMGLAHNLLLLCDSSWCSPSVCCFLCLCWLPSGVSWLLLSSMEIHRTRDLSTLNLLDELVKKLLMKSVVAQNLQICLPSPFSLFSPSWSSLQFPLLPTPVFRALGCPGAVQIGKGTPSWDEVF